MKNDGYERDSGAKNQQGPKQQQQQQRQQQQTISSSDIMTIKRVGESSGTSKRRKFEVIVAQFELAEDFRYVALACGGVVCVTLQAAAYLL
jgi:hypothetical protein